MKLIHLGFIMLTAPLVGALIAGLLGHITGRKAAHRLTILGIAVALGSALLLAKSLLLDQAAPVNQNLVTWLSGNEFFNFNFHLGFLLDPLTAIMVVVVTFVSLLVHIYSIGYMAEDSGYQRFFSYMSLFTFFMLLLVTANNFLQLFIGWEGVGLVSYLLIGFWYQREAAIAGSLKAFLVNRVGDFGFLLGMALIYTFCATLDYQQVFSMANDLASHTIVPFAHHEWSLITAICIALFVGAMGKSAQVPLHIWLPESMEGPTPISALIHAATMVTAGVFMVARMSPLFELSNTALSLILIIGATGALFTGLIAVVMNDIKRVVAYSTLSQLGYMMVAMGSSAYAVGIFHLATHAAFKALLFLGAGSVIIAMHHEQDMQKMGGLRRYLPITYTTVLIGNLALTAIPPFSGFYSKDMIIAAAHHAVIPGAHYAYYCVLIGAFVTALYTFRSFFLTFHARERMSQSVASHLHEAGWVVWLPLVLLAVPSVIMGGALIKPMLFANHGWLQRTLYVAPSHQQVMQTLSEEYTGWWPMMSHALFAPNFWFAVMGIMVAWIAYIAFPRLPEQAAAKFSFFYRILVHKYGFDELNEHILVKGTQGLGRLLFSFGERGLIDGLAVNGSGLAVRWLALRLRHIQTGYLYHYALAMLSGLVILLVWLLF